jgi:hypothetical protein
MEVTGIGKIAPPASTGSAQPYRRHVADLPLQRSLFDEAARVATTSSSFLMPPLAANVKTRGSSTKRQRIEVAELAQVQCRPDVVDRVCHGLNLAVHLHLATEPVNSSE